jgi:hypothetical protein
MRWFPYLLLSQYQRALLLNGGARNSAVAPRKPKYMTLNFLPRALFLFYSSTFLKFMYSVQLISLQIFILLHKSIHSAHPYRNCPRTARCVQRTPASAWCHHFRILVRARAPPLKVHATSLFWLFLPYNMLHKYCAHEQPPTNVTLAGNAQQIVLLPPSINCYFHI